MYDLNKFEIFKKFSKELLEKISNLITENEYKKDEVICEEGSIGDAMYIVAEGEVIIKKVIDKIKGKYKTIGIIEKGNFFGEMAIFEEKSRSASAIASKDSKILVLKQVDFMKLLHQEPEAATANLLGINRVLSQRLRVANKNFITTFEISQIMATVDNMKDLINLSLEQLSFAIEPSHVLFCELYDYLSQEFIISSVKGNESRKINIKKLTKKDSIVKDIFLNRKSIYIVNMNDNKKYPGLINKIKDAKSMLISPIFRNEKLIGVVFLVSYKTYKAFSLEDKILIDTFTLQIGPAIENIRYKEEEENLKRLQERRYSY